jgi:hypothetical protein
MNPFHPPGFRSLVLAAVWLAAAVVTRAADTPPATNAPVVLLKLDDLVRQGKQPNSTVSARWQRTADFLETEKIKGSFGILVESLEGECPAYVTWVKQRIAAGWIEIWDHGYYNRFPEELKVDDRTAENVGAPASDQAALFKKSLALTREKLGIDMVAFGPHSTAVDGATYEALEGILEIHMVWFYGPPKGQRTSKLVIQRLMELEKPLFVPNPDQLKENFEKKRATLPYVAIQGHPNQWDDERFENFKKAVIYLRDQGCRFVTPSEYLAMQAASPHPSK